MQIKFFPRLKLIDILTVITVVILCIYFRTDQPEGKLTFEWDQERDMQAVQQMVESHQPALLGPIVRGDVGGFYLGPLYYYLITPLYLITDGNPLSLMAVSVGADIAVIAFLYLFLRSRFSRTAALITSLIWAGSPLIIKNAYTPWNVSFIPLWSLTFIWTIEQLKLTHHLRYKALLVFLASLTTNIHVSLIPLAGLFLLLNWQEYRSLSRKAYLFIAVSAFLPVSPLILHDLTHHFENSILLKRFLFSTGASSTSLTQIVPIIVDKFGYTIGRLFTGEPYTLLGLGIFILVSLFAHLHQKHNPTLRTSLLMIVTLLLSLAVYRDLDFAEYYFLPTFIPILVLTAFFLRKLPRLLLYLLVPIIFVTYFRLGISVRSADISPYSLTVKKQIIQEIGILPYPVELRTNLPRERNTGFNYLMKSMNITSDPSAPRKAYIYESDNLEVIAPEEARSIILDKPIQAFKLIVFSN